MAAITAVPAQYAKFITALAGEGIAYVQLYGATWHLEAALVMLGAALAVLGVPNAPKSLTVTGERGTTTLAPLPPVGNPVGNPTQLATLPPPTGKEI